MAETTSTNDLVVAAARAGEPSGLVVVAESQTGGRGRLDRSWESPPRAGLTFSLLLRPRGVPAARLGWLPLLVGAAAAQALADLCDLDVVVKWPNDLLVGDRKVAGVLAEVAGDAVVVGLGINVLTTRAELPTEAATSLALESRHPVDRTPVLLAVLRAVGPAYTAWTGAGGDPAAVAAQYRDRCVTVGRAVRVLLPGQPAVVGTAVAVDDDGRLVVRDDAGRETALTAGDVVHVRSA